MVITHHELCFGCGQANLFGLQLELERTDDGSVRGRFFVKPPSVPGASRLRSRMLANVPRIITSWLPRREP